MACEIRLSIELSSRCQFTWRIDLCCPIFKPCAIATRTFSQDRIILTECCISIMNTQMLPKRIKKKVKQRSLNSTSQTNHYSIPTSWPSQQTLVFVSMQKLAWGYLCYLNKRYLISHYLYAGVFKTARGKWVWWKNCARISKILHQKKHIFNSTESIHFLKPPHT